MALIPIILIPDPVLRKVAAPVAEITDGTRQLLDDMADTMYDAPGIGLAAPQVNISERIIVMDCGRDDTALWPPATADPCTEGESEPYVYGDSECRKELQ